MLIYVKGNWGAYVKVCYVFRNYGGCYICCVANFGYVICLGKQPR
jgi:hypothetical protein